MKKKIKLRCDELVGDVNLKSKWCRVGDPPERGSLERAKGPDVG